MIVDCVDNITNRRSISEWSTGGCPPNVHFNHNRIARTVSIGIRQSCWSQIRNSSHFGHGTVGSINLQSHQIACRTWDLRLEADRCCIYRIRQIGKRDLCICIGDTSHLDITHDLRIDCCWRFGPCRSIQLGIWKLMLCPCTTFINGEQRVIAWPGIPLERQCQHIVGCRELCKSSIRCFRRWIFPGNPIRDGRNDSPGSGINLDQSPY